MSLKAELLREYKESLIENLPAKDQLEANISAKLSQQIENGEISHAIVQYFC